MMTNFLLTLTPEQLALRDTQRIAMLGEAKLTPEEMQAYLNMTEQEAN